MFYVSLPEKRGKIIRLLQRRLLQQRPKLCCIVNRYAENPTLNLLEQRVRFVQAFGDDIDIYGRLPWDGPDRWQEFPNYLGPTPDKQKTFSQYTFALVFENCDSTGYITEKILHTMMAGTIPLYWGGGKYLAETIPSACFVDCRDKDPQNIYHRIKYMTHDEIVAYRKAGIDFLSSDMADRFTHRYWAGAIAERLKTSTKITSVNQHPAVGENHTFLSAISL